MLNRFVHGCILIVLFGLLTVSCADRKQSEADFRNPAFDSVYNVIAIEASSTQLEHSFKRADSLMKLTANDFEEMYTLMLMATINSRRGNIDVALEQAHIRNY